MNVHEYIISEYDKQFICDYETVLRTNKSQYTASDSTLDLDAAAVFIKNNVHLFADTLLFKKIVDDACVLYGIKDSSVIPIPFTKSFNKEFFDHQNLYGGYNFFKIDRNATINEINKYFSNEVKPLLAENEWDNYSGYISLFSSPTAKYSNLYDYLNSAISDTTANYSEMYKDLLAFSKDNAEFYEKEGNNIHGDLFLDEGQLTDAGCHCVAAGALRYQCIREACSGIGPLTHEEHLNIARGMAAPRSKFVSNVCLIRDILQIIFGV